MDSKKTNITPELKEIYDRVMNTSGTPVTANPAQAAPQPAQKIDSLQPPQAPAQTPPQTPPPAASGQPAAGAAPLPSPQPGSDMPSLPSVEEALTSTPARPITEGNTFAFTGSSTKNQPTTDKKAAPTKVKGTTKISRPLIIALALVFVAVWGVFWAIFLGFIKI